MKHLINFNISFEELILNAFKIDLTCFLIMQNSNHEKLLHWIKYKKNKIIAADFNMYYSKINQKIYAIIRKYINNVKSSYYKINASEKD